MKEIKNCIKVELSLCEENEKPFLMNINENESAMTRPSSNNILFDSGISFHSPLKEENLYQTDNIINRDELIKETENSNYLFYEPNQESEINKIDLGYLDSLNELNFDFDDNFSDIDKLLYLVERMNQSLGIKKCQLQSGRT